MSFTITVRTNADGATVELAGDVPEGTYEVSGHETDTQRTLAVYRRGTDGRFIGSASHTHAKDEA